MAVGQGSEAPAYPHPVLEHVHYPRVSPGYSRGCAPPQVVPIQHLGTAGLGVCHHPCHVLAEPSCLEQPPGMAGDTPCLAGWVSPVRGAWRTKLSSCGVSLSWGGMSPGPQVGPDLSPGGQLGPPEGQFL